MGEGDGDWPGMVPPIPTPGMLWVAPQERSVNVPASNTSNAIFRRIISDLHATGGWNTLRNLMQALLGGLPGGLRTIPAEAGRNGT